MNNEESEEESASMRMAEGIGRKREPCRYSLAQRIVDWTGLEIGRRGDFTLGMDVRKPHRPRWSGFVRCWHVRS